MVLILTRKSEQGILIDGKVIVRVLAIDGERVKLGVEAPRAISVLREELVREVVGENRAAAAFHGHSGLTQHFRRLERPAGR